MTQDSLTTRLIGSAASAEPTTDDELPRTRRRLSGWQIATGDLTGDELASSLTGDLSSTPIDTESLLSTELSTASVALQTTPFLASLAARRAPKSGRSSPDVDDPVSLDVTMPLNPAIEPTQFATASASDHEREVDQVDCVGAAKPVRRLEVVELLASVQTAEIVDSHHSSTQPAAATVPLVEEARPISQETRPIAQETRPIPLETRKIASETNSLAAESTPRAQATTPISVKTSHVFTAATGAGAETQAIAPATTNIADATAPIGAVAASATVGQTEDLTKDETGALDVGLSTETMAEIERLKVRVAADSNDSDALFELSVSLHRAGLRKDSHASLTTLVSLYEKRGQHQQAARIKGMLGAPKTGPIATEELPARPADQSAVGRTAPLRDITGLIGRSRQEKKPVKTLANIHAFPPESMLFTIPLPGQEDLDDEVLDILRQSDDELNLGQYAAALDSCIQVIGFAPDYRAVYLRLAEIYTRQRLMRRARAQAEALVRLADASGDRDDLWMVYRVILHASGGDTASLRRLVELLIDSGRTDQASIYASRLIQILDAEGLDQEALAYSIRLCDLIPGDTRAALENAVLRLKNSDRGGALDRWESAVARGADPIVAKASIAALTTTINEDDHWRMLADVVPVLKAKRDQTIVDAYLRTAAMLPESPTLQAGQGLLLLAIGNNDGKALLTQAAGARGGAPMSRALAAVALAGVMAQTGKDDEYVAAVRTALKLLHDDQIASHPAWQGLVGRMPRFEDLSLELGDTLLARGDAAGAAEVLKEGHARSRHHGPMCEKLAEAYFRIGQLGSALTVLDELAVHYRTSGQLEAMASVLRQMSQLAPNNIKVKSRLIDAYLQRGFVAEARAELIQRADLEERSGLIKDAVSSLQRAADLSWTIGLADETFALYSRVIEMAPDDAGNRSALVNFYLQMGRLSEAAEHQRAVVDIALRNNHRHEAIAALHQVIGLTPDDTTAYYQLADLLASMGEYRQAEKVYRRLVLMYPDDAIAQAKATSMASLRETHA